MSAWTHYRARVAALSRDRAADDPDLLDARRDLRAARLEDYIRKLVDCAPRLTPAQRDRLAVLLRHGGEGGPRSPARLLPVSATRRPPAGSRTRSRSRWRSHTGSCMRRMTA